MKTVKISLLIIRFAKPKKNLLYDDSECSYDSVCDCKEDYIGMIQQALNHGFHE